MRKTIRSVARGVVLAGATILSLATPVLAQVPSYISSMADFQVRALQGSFAPTVGEVSIQNMTPSEWLSGDPGDLTGIIDAWSGGAKGAVGNTMYVHGGGHSDSANNGVYAFDFSGTTRPVGWTVTISSTGAVRANTATYSDGRPVSVHTYDGMLTGTNGFLYRFGGAEHINGFFITAAFKFNTNTNAWTQLSSLPGGSGFTWPITLYDPNSQKVLVAAANNFEYRIFRLNDDSYSSVKSFSGGATADGYHCGAFDSSRSRGVWFGSGSNQLVTVNWSSETASISSQSISGLPSMTGPSCFYDPATDRYWVFGGQPGSSGWTTLYEIHAGTFAVTPHPLSGDAISRSSGMIGSFGRFVFMPNYRAIGVIASISSPAYVIKLPSAGPPQPKPGPPGAVQVR